MRKDKYLAANERDLPDEAVREIKLWEKEHSRSVLSSDTGQKALAKLFWKGADPLEILRLLEAYCQSPMGPIKEEIPYGRRARNLSGRLANDLAELRSLEISVSQSCFDEVTRISGLLLDYWRESKTALTPRGSQAVFLVAAAKFVKAATGKPHYPEIALIVKAFRCGKKLDSNTISKNVINFDARGEVPYMDYPDVEYLANRLKRKWSRLLKKNPKR